MAFRADEAAARGFERARSYLIQRNVSPAEREQSEKVLREVHERCGPVIEGYPSWHPLVSDHKPQMPSRFPGEDCGYYGLDHTVYFAHGFITCPYQSNETIFESVRKLKRRHLADIQAEELDAPLYFGGTKPVLVYCDWDRPLDGHLVPKSIAVPLMLEQEVPVWRWSECGEPWETMRTYLLGEPHGNRSSLFVDQDTALAIKKIYLSLVESGMFGPVKDAPPSA